MTCLIHCLIHGGELGVQVYESARAPDPRITRGAKVKNVDYWKSKEVFDGAEVQAQSG